MRTRRIDVPTEDGRTCVIEWEERRPHIWSLDISDTLIDQAPQAVAAAITMSVLAMKEEEAGCCGCPCHEVIQPGLVPCPICDHSSR